MKNRTLIIAEAGVNHNGSLQMAKQLVEIAANAGADYVKFQTFKATELTSAAAKTASYQEANTSATSQLEMLKKLELSLADHLELVAHCKQNSIGFLSTAFDMESIDLLCDLGIDLFKIPSGEITNYPYLKRIGGLGLPIILSTGMATLEEIDAAVQVLLSQGVQKDQLTVLHCTTEYPTPMESVNLKAMLTIQDHVGVAIGYSDHTLGIEVPIAAVAMGATVIEKHFTIDQTLPGPDHKASASPSQLRQMVETIRNVETALGSEVKAPSEIELENRSVARKSIHAKTAIRKGELFSENNLTTKRPGTGISPMKWDELIGTPASKDFESDDIIE